jgi:hypothetical protein
MTLFLDKHEWACGIVVASNFSVSYQEAYKMVGERRGKLYREGVADGLFGALEFLKRDIPHGRRLARDLEEHFAAELKEEKEE